MERLAQATAVQGRKLWPELEHVVAVADDVVESLVDRRGEVLDAEGTGDAANGESVRRRTVMNTGPPLSVNVY
jgi:hypothetical protein